MTKRISRAVLTCVLCIVFFASLSALVAAVDIEAPETGRLSLTYRYDGTAFSGQEIRIYRVAEGVHEIGRFYPVGQFVDYPVDFNNVLTQDEWNQLAATLAAYAVADGITPTATAVTNAEGVAEFTDIPVGLYLVMGISVAYEEGVCTFNSSMISIPTLNEDESQWIYDVQARPKSVVYVPDQADLEFTVNKIWKDAGNEFRRPTAIRVEIYKNGVLMETVTLNESNNWSYSWTAEDDGAYWSVVERDVPEGYTVSFQGNGTTITLSNTYPTVPPPPTGDSVDLFLYVALMCISGGALLVLGLVSLKPRAI